MAAHHVKTQDPAQRSHLVVLLPQYLEAVCGGQKRTECRLTRIRTLPHGRVSPGDHLWLKEAGGPIRAVARAGRIIFFDQLTPRAIDEIRQRYNGRVLASHAFWETRRQCRYLTLIDLEDVRTVGPLHVNKSNRLPWMLLSLRKHRKLLAATTPPGDPGREPRPISKSDAAAGL